MSLQMNACILRKAAHLRAATQKCDTPRLLVPGGDGQACWGPMTQSHDEQFLLHALELSPNESVAVGPENSATPFPPAKVYSYVNK